MGVLFKFLVCLLFLQPTNGVEVFKSLLKLIFSDTTSTTIQQVLEEHNHQNNNHQNMKVIGAGYSRTGTDSLRTALTRLGYKSYHGQKVMTEKNHLLFWKKYLLNNEEDTIFSMIQNEGYNATTDYPGCLVFEKYMELYPDAKVILSLHPKGSLAWAKSYSNTRQMMGLDPNNYQPSIQSLMDSYENWIIHVKATVPSSKLLVHNATEGYGPIVKFLNMPLKTDSSQETDHRHHHGNKYKDEEEEVYPNVNDSNELSRQIEMFEIIAEWWNCFFISGIMSSLLMMRALIRCCQTSSPTKLDLKMS